MGRIVAPVKISNAIDREQKILCDALVDTGASYMVLPIAWRQKLGVLEKIDTIELELSDQSIKTGDICGPVMIQLEGFRPVFSEVLFIDMKPENEMYEPLIGYIILEQCQAGVDMLGHRLVHVKTMDLKKFSRR